MNREYDLVVLGGGPAGYPAAIEAAREGAKVCLVEKGPLGGVCLNWGCIPTKTLHGLAHLVERSRAGTGGVEMGVDAEELFAHKSRVVGDLVAGIEKLLRGRGVELLRGEGRITAPGRLEVEGAGTVSGRAVLLASGSSEIELPGLAFDGKRILSSADLLDLGRIPASLVVVGGGAIGCEFASIFNALGSRVSIVEMLPALVATEDAQISRQLAAFLRRKGIALHLKRTVGRAEVRGNAAVAVLDDGTELEAEAILVSVGRRPNVAGSGIGELGIERSGAGVVVDERMATSVPGIYAAGDVVGGYLLAHVATREGLVAVSNILGKPAAMRYDAVPSTIYSLPEIARVGLTEEQAGERGIEYLTGRFPFAANGKAKGLGEEEGFVKWIASKKDGTLLGLHIIGPQATELVSAGIIAVRRGMTIDDFTDAIFPHPTLSEALAEAAEGAIGRQIHLLRSEPGKR